LKERSHQVYKIGEVDDGIKVIEDQVIFPMQAVPPANNLYSNRQYYIYDERVKVMRPLVFYPGKQGNNETQNINEHIYRKSVQ